MTATRHQQWQVVVDRKMVLVDAHGWRTEVDEFVFCDNPERAENASHQVTALPWSQLEFSPRRNIASPGQETGR